MAVEVEANAVEEERRDDRSAVARCEGRVHKD